MRLIRFQIQNFRSIEDTAGVDVGRTTVLVGKNESGKTAILKALQKLNPKATLSFDKLREFPRRRYHEFDEDHTYPVVTASFELDDGDRAALSRAAPELSETTSVIVVQDFSGERNFTFSPREPQALTLEMCSGEVAEIQEAVTSLQKESGDSQFTAARDLVLRFVEDFFASATKDEEIRSGPGKRRIRSTSNKLKQSASGFPRPASLEPLAKSFEVLLRKSEEPSPRMEAEKVVMRRMPRFIYFDVFQELENKVQLSAFVQRKKAGSMTKEDATADTLFTLAGLDVERLVELERIEGKTPNQIQRSKDERALLVSRASLGLSGRIVDIWKQRRNRVEFYLDGDYLRLWVVDEKDGSKLEYEEQSKGFHWFFSFYHL